MSNEAISRELERHCVIESVRKLVKLCVQRDVKIVANQKVVGRDIKKIFRENDIIILERFGCDGIKRLKSVSSSSCFPLNNTNDSPLILESFPILGKMSGNKTEVIIPVYLKLSDDHFHILLKIHFEFMRLYAISLF